MAGTDLCQALRLAYQVQGHLGVRMHDGTELEIHAGEVNSLPPGQSAWVIGDQAVVSIDWQGPSV